MSIETTPPGKEEVVPSTNLTPPGKKFSRRKIIALAGTGTFVLVAGGGVWCAEDQGVFSTGQGPAYEPWDDWRSTTKGPLNALGDDPDVRVFWLASAEKRASIGNLLVEATNAFVADKVQDNVDMGTTPLTLAMPCTRWWVMLPGRPS